MYMSIPSKADATHKTNVGRIIFFREKQFLRSVLKCQDATSQMPSVTATSPDATWMSVIMTGASKNAIPGELNEILKEGPMTATTVIKCRTTAEAIAIPCWRYFFLFFNRSAKMSRTRTATCKAKLAVAPIGKAMINPETIS